MNEYKVQIHGLREELRVKTEEYKTVLNSMPQVIRKHVGEERARTQAELERQRKRYQELSENLRMTCDSLEEMRLQKEEVNAFRLDLERENEQYKLKWDAACSRVIELQEVVRKLKNDSKKS